MLELLAQTTQPDHNWYEALNRVRDFYNDAFMIVLGVLLLIVAIVGGLVPLVIAWLQRRRFTKEGDRLLQGAYQKMEADQERLHREVRQEMASELEQLRQEVRQSMAADQQLMLRNVRRDINSEMGKTCWWIARNAARWQPEYSVMMYLHGTTYFVMAGNTALATECAAEADSVLLSILGRAGFKALTMKSALNTALKRVKELVDSQGMGKDLDDQLGRIEEAIEGAEPRDDGGAAGADAEPPATGDDE